MRRLAVILVLASGAAMAQSAPDAELAERGRALAGQWCAQCHAIAPGAVPPTGDATLSLPAIAAQPRSTPEGLRALLLAPHPGMPDHQLSRADLDALVAYMQGLRP